MGCKTVFEVELVACEAEYYLFGFGPLQPYWIVMEAGEVRVSRMYISDTEGVITLLESDFVAGWFGAYRFLRISAADALAAPLLFSKAGITYDSIIMALKPFEQHTVHETKITGKWIYSQ